ncbi:hypothetical protein N800_00130 [Lysobacter daejeonensis GH1-9]|uniref:Uncharacterized protein n=1 Tax=Lysobacter daejeonensis GH1-9 TaxID=1385517 RepID=A0A0A0EX36_9GAMM|nr:hypothetical protein [Lysobacter daejeonensis]KGM55079.1 hypothetical protein N800_00130 [Lysobacter daejeonensis GH1-9]
MLLAKTDKARTAIQNRDAGLSAQDRHILIVSNGQRSLNDIVSMLGPATLAPIDRLLREGYLQAAAGERGADQVAGAAGQGMGALLRASRDLATRVQERAQAAIEAATAAPAATAPPAPTGTLAEQVAALPPPPPVPRVGPRRSTAAAKMYMLDMLQLQRSVEAATLKVAIQSSSSGDEVLASLVESLRHLRSVATESYYTRVTTRLGEVLPEEFVPRLAASLRIDATACSAA